MDLRWLLLLTVVMGIVGFLLGRRTSPGGRAVSRLQRQIDAKQQELNHHQIETNQFLAEVQQELERVSSAYQALQTRLRSGAEHLASSAGATAPAIDPSHSAKKPVVTTVSSAISNKPDATDSPEWTARMAGSWGGAGTAPLRVSAAACPVPEYRSLEAPKDYPAPRRGSSYDEHSYA